MLEFYATLKGELYSKWVHPISLVDLQTISPSSPGPHPTFTPHSLGVSATELKAECDDLLSSTHLTHKQNELTGSLSGGMKRRLSTSFAVIGACVCMCESVCVFFGAHATALLSSAPLHFLHLRPHQVLRVGRAQLGSRSVEPPPAVGPHQVAQEGQNHPAHYALYGRV